MKIAFIILPLLVLCSQCRPKDTETKLQFQGKPAVPASIKKEHTELLDRVHGFTLFNDSTAAIAVKLEELMQHHFKEEEDYVLPPLGLLPLLAAGQQPDHTEEVMGLIEKMKSQMIHMDAEHQMIKALLDELKTVAVKKNHSAVLEFDSALRHHALTEKEILFPTAVLIGEYLKSTQLNSKH